MKNILLCHELKEQKLIAKPRSMQKRQYFDKGYGIDSGFKIRSICKNESRDIIGLGKFGNPGYLQNNHASCSSD